jgi:hypothetical protein
VLKFLIVISRIHEHAPPQKSHHAKVRREISHFPVAD